MTITKESTRSLFDLWRDSHHLLSAVKAHQARMKLLRREGELTELVEVVAIDPRIIELEKALQAALPLFKDALDSDLFEEWLIGGDSSDESEVPF